MRDREGKITSIGLCAVALAVLILAHTVRLSFDGLPLSIWLIAYPLFIALVLFWGSSLFMRIVDPVSRRYLLYACFLILFWLFVRVIKLSTYDPAVERLLWYLYYLPMTMLPVLLFWTGLRIGGFDERPKYVLAKWLPFSVAVLLTVLVLSNDRTQLVFNFYAGIENFGEQYSYGWPYYFVFARSIYLILLFMAATAMGSRELSKSRLVPLAVVALLTLFYGLGYALRLPILFLSTEMTLVYCTVSLVFIELSVYSGLIPSRRLLSSIVEATAGSATSTSAAVSRTGGLPTTTADLSGLLADISLTSRERELLLALLRGQSPKAIAADFAVSRSTVDFHTGNLYRKMSVQSRHELLVKVLNAATKKPSATTRELVQAREYSEHPDLVGGSNIIKR